MSWARARALARSPLRAQLCELTLCAAKFVRNFGEFVQEFECGCVRMSADTEGHSPVLARERRVQKAPSRASPPHSWRAHCLLLALRVFALKPERPFAERLADGHTVLVCLTAEGGMGGIAARAWRRWR